MDLKLDQLKGLFSGLKDKSSEYAGIAVNKTKDAARLAKAAVELNSEKDMLKKTFAELGQTYYEEFRGTAEGLYAQLCEEADAIQDRIDTLQREIDALKNGFKPEEAPDFESVVAADETGEADIEVEIVEEE